MVALYDDNFSEQMMILLIKWMFFFYKLKVQNMLLFIYFSLFFSFRFMLLIFVK